MTQDLRCSSVLLVLTERKHCEDYVRELSKVFPPKDLARINPSTTLTIIGCGESAAIAGYKERTSTSFPIYCDPSRALYAKLGMTSSLSLGNQRPDYVKSSLIGGTLSSMATMISSGSMALKGGNYSQNGGEWVFVDGHLEWCHRMQNTRDHAEVKDLGDVLGFKMKD